MVDLLNFIKSGKSPFQLAQTAISEDDVNQLKQILCDSDISYTTCLENSPKENLLTYAIHRNAENCCIYLLNTLKWPCLINKDTVFCPVYLCFIQCYFPVCFELFRILEEHFPTILEKAPKQCTSYQLLRHLSWPVEPEVATQQMSSDEIALNEELQLANKESFVAIYSLMVLCRAKIRAVIRDSMIERCQKKIPTPNYLYLISQLSLPVRLVYFLAYSDTWPFWKKSETKPYRGRPRLPAIIMDLY